MKKALFLSFVLVFLASCNQEPVQQVSQEPVVVEQNNESTPVEETISEDPSMEDMVEESTQEASSYSFEMIIDSISDSRKSSAMFNQCLANSVDSCLMEAAYSEDIEPSCDEFITNYNRESCEESKIIMQAKEEKNVALCDSLSLNKENCVLEVVVAEGLETYDASVCDRVDEMYLVECNNTIVKEQALNEGSVEVCAAIMGYSEGDTYEQQFCEEEVAYKLEMEAYEEASAMEMVDTNVEESIDSENNEM